MLWNCIVKVRHQGLVQKSEIKGQHEYKQLKGKFYNHCQGVSPDHEDYDIKI